MYRTVMLRVGAAVLCLSVTATLAFATPVKHGTMDICQTTDGSQSWIDGAGIEVCCMRDSQGVFSCVECDPPGSDNCDSWTESKAPGERVVTILVTRALEEQRAIRTELESLPAKIKELCAPAPPSNR